jgi:hypothetical protein
VRARLLRIGVGYVPKKSEPWHALTEEQIATAVEFAQAREPGRYTLREIYGDQWQFVIRPRRLGRLFKRAVDSFAVPGIRWVGRKSNKSHV